MAPAPIVPPSDEGVLSPGSSSVVAEFLKSIKRTTPSNIKDFLEPRNIPTKSLETNMEGTKILAARDKEPTTPLPVYGEGAIDPHSINMQGMLALFALLGAALVIAAIWFFFWAKNGGFIWRENDWDDYKSTVLRRKGPDGRTLSNATKSTALGGGSIVAREYRDYDDATTAMETETVATGKTGRTRRGFIAMKKKLLRRQKESDWEGGHDEDMRAYRHEKPAQVGGMNREADGTYHGSDFTPTNTHTNTHNAGSEAGYTYTYDEKSQWTQSQAGYTNKYEEMDISRGRNASGFSFVAGEDTVSHVTEEQRPLREPSPPPRRRDTDHRRTAGSRTDASRTEASRSDVSRSEASRSEVSDTERRSRHARHSQRPRGPRTSTSNNRQSTSRKRTSMPGSYTEPLDMSEYSYQHLDGSDNGTSNMSYHQPLPALSKGYRRTGRGRRRDSLSDSDGE
ncbi:TPA_exp: Uncharacterized protein A8136_2392 [Trichophyton benhamiae CBS 112371]|uniref:Endosomal SPRY domain protein n=1 Tax=Arthroderma benhamiae (strain ATCC MYA-4681 / CBS 112371) TaxID=663331 RepID=D4AM26_ARTBC|nr:uncharacterized protein ARB_04716 [Trichophyton benhamiae CBS 112371]EFE35782.1 conserved hypothetical protein [Trichophyton benhamiae CBS 112371]DAA78607.1 TPA_exp: Uncharacterized protein A8136_2392 [Trichophyton benhamiae CBS 112371]